MVIPWNALGVVGGAIVFVYDRTKDRRAKAKAEQASMPPAPAFENGAADVALFTTYRGDDQAVRHFDEDLKPGLLAALDARGLRHVPASQLAAPGEGADEEAAKLAALGSFYMVVPLTEGETSAGETVRACQESGGVVLGSLSLIALPVGGPYPMLVAVGGRELEASANAAGEFAVLSTRAAETAKTEPPAAPAEAAEVAAAIDAATAEVDGIIEDAAAKQRQNGAAKSAQPIVLGSVFDLAKEEGT